jgi:archaemetzincin
MANRENPTAVQALLFLTIGAFPRTIAEDLIARVSRRVSIPCRLAEKALKESLPLLPDREQVDADALLKRLEDERTDPGTLIVGMTMRDLGIKIFTFVFGRARRNGHAALVSMARLRPEFYGLPPDPDLTTRRSVAEIVHELGHVMGLDHCEDFGCIMHFANNAETIDLRGTTFCTTCSSELPEGFLSSTAGFG